MKNNFKHLALAFAGVSALAAASASAQNLAHGPGDLILTIQNPGGSTNSTGINIAVLGATTLFRDAAPGSYTPLLNISSALTTYGADWYEQSSLYLGAVDYRGNNGASTSLLGGDPARTLYLTKARSNVGTVGQANSVLNPIGIGNADTIVSRIESVKLNIEGLSGSQTIGTFNTSTSNVDDQNPFTVPGVQGAGYGVVSGGIQGNLGAGSFGSFGGAGTIEFALDLYRVQFINDISGQYGFGQATQTGQYLGTITLNQAGQLGYVAAAAVPEPSTIGLLGLAGLGLASYRRRRAAVAA